MQAIEKFDGEFEFLSNFHQHPITIDGITFPTSEHAFQAAKTHDRATKLTIAAKPKPGQAKRAGGKRGIIKGDLFRQDWEQVKVSIMREILKLKFSDPTLKQALLATEDRPLIEGNIWNDTFWGVCKGKGKNTLGKLLEEIRAELRS